MTPPIRERRPGSLWAGGAPPRQVVRPAPRPRAPEPPPPPRPGRDGRWLTGAAVVVAALLLALGLVIGEAVDGDGTPAQEAPLVSGGSLGRTDVGRVYAAAGPGVVSVQAGSGSGTGFVVDGDGTIVTNAHVVEGASSALVRFGDRGRQVSARVLGVDGSSDLAALHVDPDDAGSLRALRLADSDAVHVGDDVVAIGHPFGLDRTATAGIVSGVGRAIRAPNGFEIDEVIQTDAPINPGNSGGPLLDWRGRVIGVNSQIATAGNRGNVGIGFAVPSNAVRDVIPRLKRGERVVRPYLGVTTAPAGGAGATVAGLEPGGPAADAGLRAGDRIVSIDGRRVREPDDVNGVIDGRRPGDRVTVEVERDRERKEIEVTLGTRPERTP
jgi:putative serine protease PepD